MISLALALAVAVDTSRYVVLNHGRFAGDMTIARSGDTVVVRYQHLGRNRGAVAARSYRIDKTGRLVYGESLAWQFGGEIGAPTDRFEMVRDSAVFGLAAPQMMRSVWEPDMFPRLRAPGTAYDVALQAKFLLSRPNRTGRLMPGTQPTHAE